MSDEQKKDVQEEVKEEKAPETTPEETTEKVEEVKEEKKEEAPVEESKEETKTEETPAEEPAEETPSEEPAKEAPYKAKLTDFQGHEEIEPGMTVRVHEKIKDVTPRGDIRERVQVFEGMVLWLKGSGPGRTITVRKNSKGFGVEKIYPINSPVVEKIELVKKARVRRAKLGYLKNAKRRFKRRLKETRYGTQTKKKKK